MISAAFSPLLERLQRLGGSILGRRGTSDFKVAPGAARPYEAQKRKPKQAR